MELKGGLFGVRFEHLVASSQSDANSDFTREICQRVIATIQLVQKQELWIQTLCIRRCLRAFVVFVIEPAKPHKPPNVFRTPTGQYVAKKTARYVYAMGKNGKEPENLDFSSVAATFEKASTYVFAGRLIRNAVPRCGNAGRDVRRIENRCDNWP